MHVREQRFKSTRQGSVRYVQEARAARSTYELPARDGEEVAFDCRYIDRHLTHRLACVNQKQHVARGTDRSDLLNRLDEARTGGHVCDRDQLGHSTLNHGTHLGDVDATIG